MFSKLQYISQGKTAEAQLHNIQQALDAGCGWIQLRFKNADANALTTLAKRVKTLCTEHEATFIINDHPHIAKETDADGVHVGLNDMPVSDAKKIVGDKIIGGTANTLQDVLQRVAEGCSYIGLGPFRFTETKEKLSPILGLTGFKNIMDELARREIQIPVYAIGGILLDDIVPLLQTGIYGVAVSGLITNHSEKKLLLEKFNNVLYEAVNHIR